MIPASASPGSLLNSRSVDSQQNAGPAPSRRFTVTFQVVVGAVLPLAVLACSALLVVHNDVAGVAPSLRRRTPSLPSASPSASPSDALDFPTINVVYPSQQLEQQLAHCAGYCSGNPPSEGAESLLPPFSGGSDAAFLLASEKAYGPPLPIADLYPEGWPFVLRHTDQFALNNIVSLRMHALASSQDPLSTPSSADFLFLSLDTLEIARCIQACRHAGALPTSLDRKALNQSITDWLVSTVEANRGRRSYPSIILSLSLIDHDYEENLLAEDVQEVIKDDVVVLGIERKPWQTVDKLSTFFQVPYPSTMHLPLRALPQSDLGDWQLAQNRSYLVSFGGKRVRNSPTSGKGPFNGFPLRAHLATSLLSHNLSHSLYLHIFSTRSHRTEIAALHIAMSRSTFCLQPAGDSPTRKGFWDSILLGCIPVIFRSGTYARVFEEFFEQDIEETVAVVLEEKEVLEGRVDVVEWLSGVSEEEVRRKRKAMARLAERVQYGVPTDRGSLENEGWTSDAFGGIIRQLVGIKERGRWGDAGGGIIE